MTHQEYIYKLIAWSLEWEGTIGISRSKNKCNNIGYKANVRICNLDKELLEEFKNTIKIGNINNGTIYGEHESKVYEWLLTRKEIDLYLPLILPNLISKWRQAELAIEANKILKTKKYRDSLKTFQEKRDMYTWEELLTLEAIYQECKELNDKLLKIKKRKLL